MKLDEKGLNPSIIKRYDSLMFYLGLEHETLSPEYEWYRDEDTSHWNLKDTVAECDYQLSCYYEDGHMLCEMKEDNPKQWRADTGRLKRYIDRYLPICNELGLKTFARHCSKYDD